MAFPKIDGFVVTEKLGSGSYSTVYKAYTKVGAKTVVAIKCVDKSRVKHSGSAVDNLITEIRLLKTLRHPHIVHMRDFTWDQKNIYIITEYCCGGDLSKYIHRYGRVPERQVLYFLQQLASALKFLREKGVVHMDLKPHNLLLMKGADRKYILKVADFGFAQYVSAAGGVRGSPLYMAPEVLAAGGGYDERVDLWSVGVIMYECLFGKAPYSSSTFKELIDKIQKKQPIEAVALLRRAVALEAAGGAARASAAYRAGLRYLLPAAEAEPEPARRHALRAKAAGYMQRAEELQARGGAGGAALAAADHARPRPRGNNINCCVSGNELSSGSFDFSEQNGRPDEAARGCARAGQYRESGSTDQNCEEVTDANEDGAEMNKTEGAAGGVAGGVAGGAGGVAEGAGGVAALRRRLFGRRADARASEDSGEEVKHPKVDAGEAASDGCRIT